MFIITTNISNLIILPDNSKSIFVIHFIDVLFIFKLKNIINPINLEQSTYNLII